MRSAISKAFYLLWLAYQTTHSSLLPRLPSGIPVLLGNITFLNEETAPAWVPPPKARRTLNILNTCIITLTLYVYTAVHINVPPPGAGKWWRYLHLGKWTVLGIFPPEVVLYTAWDQFWEATQLQKALNKEAKKQFEDSTSLASQESTFFNNALTFGC
jgi:hypothetical protein